MHCVVYFCLVMCLDLILCVNIEKGNNDDDDDDDESIPITLTIVLYIENGLLNM